MTIDLGAGLGHLKNQDDVVYVVMQETEYGRSLVSNFADGGFSVHVSPVSAWACARAARDLTGREARVLEMRYAKEDTLQKTLGCERAEESEPANHRLENLSRGDGQALLEKMRVILDARDTMASNNQSEMAHYVLVWPASRRTLRWFPGTDSLRIAVAIDPMYLGSAVHHLHAPLPDGTHLDVSGPRLEHVIEIGQAAIDHALVLAGFLSPP